MNIAFRSSGSSSALGAEVHALPYPSEPDALVAGLSRRHPGAAAAFHRRYVTRISGMLYRLLGPDPELNDVLHDCFVRALGSIEQIRDPAALDSWVMGVTVMTAKTHLQRRMRRSWLRLSRNDELPEPAFEDTEPSLREALRVTYKILDRLSVDERVIFVLRHNEQMTVAAMADHLELSVSTVKRRLGRAEQRFLVMARKEPALQSWLLLWDEKHDSLAPKQAELEGRIS